MRIIHIKQKLKEYFFLNPTAKLRVRQIERIVKIPLPSAIRYTKELEKEQILKSSRIADIIIYSSNRTSKIFLLEKKLFNIRQIHDAGLLEYLITELGSPIIIVFGSYSRGEDIENSDIDLYIETPAKKKINLKNFENKLERKIQIFAHNNLKEIPNKELANNIINGTILNGFIEAFE